MFQDSAHKLHLLRGLRPLSVICLVAVGTLTACAKQENSELQWARAALERNPQVKVLAVDAAKNTLQVRIKSTGETVTVTPGELAALPISDLLVLTNALRAPPPAVAPQQTEVPIPADTAPVTEEVVASVAEPPKPEYTVQREDGRVRVTGPGVSIETHKPTAEVIPTATRFDEPIVCDGKRMLHLDNKRITVEGDAITVRGGCELYITNSYISATGTAVTALDATVHITNSELQGGEGSLTTSSAAHVFLRTSKFSGLARRDPQSAIQDQGGNIWR